MTNYNRLLILITFLFIDLSIGFAQKTWKSDKYAYTVEIPSGYLIRKPTGKNIYISLLFHIGYFYVVHLYLMLFYLNGLDNLIYQNHTSIYISGLSSKLDIIN